MIMLGSIGVEDGGREGRHVPPKIRENIYRAIIMQNGHFSGKYHEKFGNFVNFLWKIS